MWFGRIRKHSISDASSTAITVNGNVRDQLAKPPANGHQAEKGDDRGDGGRKTGAAIRCAAVLGRQQRRLAQVARPEIGMFAHHDGIIDHDRPA